MRIFNARTIDMPADFSAQMARRAGYKDNTLDNMLADSGMLHELRESLIAIAMTPVINTLLTDKDLKDGSEPLSLERFSNTLWFLTFAYGLGIIKLEDGKALMGDDADYGVIKDFMACDQIQLRNGKLMDAELYKMKLLMATSEQVVDDIYAQVVKVHPVTRKKSVSAQSNLFAAVVAAMKIADSIGE